MFLSVRATARTPRTPAPLASWHPPWSTTVAAQKPAAHLTRWVFQPQKPPFCMCQLYSILFFYQGVCGWWYGSPSGEWVGRRVQEMQLHWPAGQRHSAPRGPVQTSRVWSELSSGEISANMSNKHHKYSHSTGNVHVWHVLQGSTYTPVKGECCGKCTQTSCVESAGDMRGDTVIGGKLRNVCPTKWDFFKVLLL